MVVEDLLYYVYDRRFIYQLIGTLTTYLAIKVAKFIHYRRDRYKIFSEYGIPGPKPSLLDGHVRVYKQNECFFKLEQQWANKYGDFYGVFIGDEPSIITTNLNVLKTVFFEEMRSFTERGNVFIESPITLGILFARHPRWKVMRKALSPAFKSYAIRGQKSTQFLEESLTLMIKYIDEKIRKAELVKEKAVVDIQDVMKSTALHFISHMAVKLPDVQVRENEDKVKSLDEFLALSDDGIVLWAVRFPFIKSILQFLSNHFEHNKIMSKITKILDKRIDQGLKRLSERKKKGDCNTEEAQIIDELIKLHYEGKLTRDEVIGNAEAILLAGYDTTSTTTAYLFWLLAKNQDLQERLRLDVMAHGTGSKYLNQVLNETLRLYPAVPTFASRLANQTVESNGWFIPKGTRVVYNSWLMHRDPKIWTDPEKFDPERFRDGVEYHPCAYAPFGMGDKKCLGQQLAVLELKMVTCDLLLRYKVGLRSPENLEMITYARALTKPKETVLIEFERL